MQSFTQVCYLQSVECGTQAGNTNICLFLCCAHREIPRPPQDEFGPVVEAVFFKVPYDAGGDSSYRAGDRGRGPGWFKSEAYDKYQRHLKKELLQQAAASSSKAAATMQAAPAAPDAVRALQAVSGDQAIKAVAKKKGK